MKKNENKKHFFIIVILSLVSTIILLNCSSYYFVGIPTFLYSIFPWGIPFLVIETFLYSVLFILIIIWGKRFKRKYLFYAFLKPGLMRPAGFEPATTSSVG